MKKLLLMVVTGALCAFIMSGCGSSDNSAGTDAYNDSNDQGDVISFGVPSWTSTVPPTEIASIILEDMGYEIEEVEADAGAVYAGLSRGDIDVFMDSWFPAQQHYVDDKFSDEIEDVALSYDEAGSGFAVPEYLEDINDVGDIVGKEDEFDNELLSIGKGDPATENLDKVIDGYDLDVTQVNSSEGGMMAEVIRKMEKEEPVLFYGWHPHSMFNKYDVKLLTNEETPEWFKDSSVHVVVNKELKDSHPEVYAFLENWSIPLEDVEEMISKIDDKEEPEEVAQEWVDDHQEEIDETLGK